MGDRTKVELGTGKNRLWERKIIEWGTGRQPCGGQEDNREGFVKDRSKFVITKMGPDDMFGLDVLQ